MVKLIIVRKVGRKLPVGEGDGIVIPAPSDKAIRKMKYKQKVIIKSFVPTHGICARYESIGSRATFRVKKC